MKNELVLFGRHFDMAPRINRRRLVWLMYCGFAMLIVAGWFLDRWHVWGLGLVVFSVSNFARLVLGGYGVAGGGMVKPFLGTEVRERYLKNPDSYWSKMARRNVPSIDDKSRVSSDERELRLRDKAHEAAYRRLGMILIVTFMTAGLKYAGLPLMQIYGIDLSAAVLDQVIYGLLIVSFILFLTLPQAILLWTEPDMEEVR